MAGPDGGTLYTYDSGADGFFTKTFFYDTGEQVVAFDAQFTPTLADAALAWLAAQTDSPVTHLVITRPNPDKFNVADMIGFSVYGLVNAKFCPPTTLPTILLARSRITMTGSAPSCIAICRHSWRRLTPNSRPPM